MLDCFLQIVHILNLSHCIWIVSFKFSPYKLTILGMNHLQYSQNSELPSASNLWEGSIKIPHVHWLVWAFFAPYCAKFEISWKRSWCWDVIKCLVHFVTKMIPFYTCRKIWLHCLKTNMRLSNIWHTSCLLNMLWVPPPCASRTGVKRLQLWQLFSVDEKRERIPLSFRVSYHQPASKTPFKWHYGL